MGPATAKQVQAKALPEATHAAQSRNGDMRIKEGNPIVRATGRMKKNMFRAARLRKLNDRKILCDDSSTFDLLEGKRRAFTKSKLHVRLFIVCRLE